MIVSFFIIQKIRALNLLNFYNNIFKITKKGVCDMEYSGIDVSEIQGKINWKSVCLRKIKFAMLRATYVLSGIDSQFETNIKNIASTEIFPGAYHQSSANSVNDAIKEAQHFLNTIKPYKIYRALFFYYKKTKTLVYIN